MPLSIVTRCALGAIAGLATRALLARGGRRRRDQRRQRPAAVSPAAVSPAAVSPAAVSPAAGRLRAGAATLATSVLLDSAAEHFRGGFYSPTMYLAPAMSALTLGASAGGPGAARRGVFALAVATGLVGTGFHVYNVARRTGGFRWENVLYGAPIAAPVGITAAGLAGLAAQSLERGSRLAGFPAGPILTVGAAAGLIGTAAEAGLLHFRGAFHNPFMYVPVTVPPLAAAALGLAALFPSRATLRTATILAEAALAAGVIGVGFHAYGVKRNMGGWKNWSQNLQVAPPLPAPLAFTGMALIALAGLALLGEADD